MLGNEVLIQGLARSLLGIRVAVRLHAKLGAVGSHAHPAACNLGLFRGLHHRARLGCDLSSHLARHTQLHQNLVQAFAVPRVLRVQANQMPQSRGGCLQIVLLHGSTCEPDVRVAASTLISHGLVQACQRLQAGQVVRLQIQQSLHVGDEATRDLRPLGLPHGVLQVNESAV